MKNKINSESILHKAPSERVVKINMPLGKKCSRKTPLSGVIDEEAFLKQYPEAQKHLAMSEADGECFYKAPLVLVRILQNQCFIYFRGLMLVVNS